MRQSERGMSMWPFVIALVLLLAFIFLWYGQREDAEKLKAENDRLTKVELPAIQGKFAETLEELGELSKAVGYMTATREGRTVTDRKALEAALNPDQAGSPLGELRTKSTLAVKREFFKLKAGAPTTPLDLARLPTEFKTKVQAAKDAFPGALPPMPSDPDDAVAMAEYAAKRKEYDAKWDVYHQRLNDLVKDKDFPVYSTVIGVGAGWDPDKTDVVNVPFWERPATGMMTVEEFLKLPPKIVEGMGSVMRERMDSLQAQIDALTKANDELKKVSDNADPAALGLKQQLEAVQQQLAADTARLQQEAQNARTALEQIRVTETAAQQALAKEKEDRKVDVSKLEQSNRALENRIRTDKEVRDLSIQRDDPDGIVLAADNRLETGYINLGSSDKVFAGLPFRVSYMGRGGIRQTKGEVVVTRVLDSHYSQVRIASMVDGVRPIGPGDMISNPFFDATKPIYVYLAGDLKKYPKSVAVTRLQRMGVVVQDAIDAKTDWVVVPDSIVATPTAAPAEGEGEAGAAPSESEYDRLERMARPFGATLVTERIIEAFLGY